MLSCMSGNSYCGGVAVLTSSLQLSIPIERSRSIDTETIQLRVVNAEFGSYFLILFRSFLESFYLLP